MSGGFNSWCLWQAILDYWRWLRHWFEGNRPQFPDFSARIDEQCEAWLPTWERLSAYPGKITHGVDWALIPAFEIVARELVLTKAQRAIFDAGGEAATRLGLQFNMTYLRLNEGEQLEYLASPDPDSHGRFYITTPSAIDYPQLASPPYKAADVKPLTDELSARYPIPVNRRRIEFAKLLGPQATAEVGYIARGVNIPWDERTIAATLPASVVDSVDILAVRHKAEAEVNAMIERRLVVPTEFVLALWQNEAYRAVIGVLSRDRAACFMQHRENPASVDTPDAAAGPAESRRHPSQEPPLSGGGTLQGFPDAAPSCAAEAIE